MFGFQNGYMIVPEPVYTVLLYGGGIFAVISLVALALCALLKKGKDTMIAWAVDLVLALLLVWLTTGGTIVAHTMLGG